MGHNTQGQKHDANGWKINQYYNRGEDKYEAVEGAYGGQNVRSVPDDYVPITPSDSSDLADGPTAFGLLATAAGNVSVVTFKGRTVTLPIAANQPLIGRFKRVRATGTTATGLFALY